MAVSSSVPPTRSLSGVRVPLQTFSERLSYGLMGVNIALFLITSFWGNSAYAYGALLPDRVLYAGEWWRIITSAFMHGGWLHIASNMYALYFLGSGCEHFFGPWRFLGIYATSMVGSGILVTLLSLPGTMTVGASGAILGLLGSLLVYFWKYRHAVPGSSQRFKTLLQAGAVNVLLGLSPGISLWGHVGGILAGAMMGWALLPRYQFEPVLFRMTMKRLEKFQWLAVIGVIATWALALGLSKGRV